MPELSLYDYTKRIDQMIARNGAEEAIAHCRQLLSYYPKYLPAYRLLARACLAKGDLAHASHFYQCVLSANPQEADAWLHLALLSSDLGELEQATWLMERAFEVEPGNAQIRGHLRQLYSRRDGTERTHIQLTAGALAHLYARAGFHKRAIRELERLLQTSLDQSPLHIAHLETALAESLWYTEGQAPLADKICQSLLRKLPNCLQANLIMAQIRWNAGLEDEAEPYLQVIRALDPEGQFASDMMGNQAPITRTAIEIPYLAYEAPPRPGAQLQPEVSTADDTSWLDQVGKITAETDQLTPAPQAEIAAPDWLEEWPEQTADQSDEVVTAEGMTEDSVDAREAPHWLYETEERAESHTDWLSDLQNEGPQEAPEEISTPATGTVQTAADEEGQEVAAEDEFPDWLRELSDGPEAEVTAAPLASQEPDKELPEWLVELQVEESQEITQDTSEPAAEALSVEELPDWLKELSEESVNAIEDEEDVPLEASPAQAVTELEAEEELPEWLTDLDAEVEEAEPAVVDEAATGEVGEEDLPAWLIELEAEPGQGMPDAAEGEVGEQGPSTAQQVSEEEMPDWLSQLGIEEETGEAMPTSQGATESSAQDSAPDWLAELEAEESEQPGFEAVAEDELPDWLTELDMDHEDTEATVIAPVSSEEESLDWLSEIGDESPADISVEAKEEGGVADAVPASEDEGLPQWLGEFGEEGGQDVPEWLVELQEGQVDEQLATEDDRVSESAEQQDVEPISDDELPDWLRELSAEPEADDTGSAEALAGVTAPELPSDSLAEAEPELVQMEGAQPAAKGEEEATAPEERMHEATAQEGAPGEPIEPRSEPIEPDIAATSDRAPPAVETAAAVASISQLPPPEEGMPEWLLTLEDEIRQQLGVPAGERQPAPSESSAAEQGWVEDTEPAAETEEVLGTTDEAAVSEPESVAEVEEAEKSPTIESIEAADGRPMGEFLPDQEQVPEWLAALEATVGNDSVTSTTQKELGEHPVEPETVPEWLQELEEEAQVEDLVAEMSDAGAAADTPEAQEHTPITETETPVELGSPETEATVEAYDSTLATAPHEHETRLALAAAYLEEDNLDRAAQEYEQLVKVPSLVERVTVTLERKTEEHPDHHALQRVLGDAYMRSGQLQKALAAYKRALATL